MRRFGLLGVAIGTAIPVLVANLCVVTPVLCRQLDIRIVDFARLVAVAPLVGAAIAAVALWTVATSWPPQSVLAILLEGGVVGIIYLASVWTFGLDRSLRERYTAFARHMIALATQRRAPAPLV